MNQPSSNPLAPRLGVVLATDCFKTIRPVLSSLRKQSECGRIEVILVAPIGGLRDFEEAEVTSFAAVRRVEIPSIDYLSVARAAGVRAATAPVVYIGETHSFPQPGWAEVLLRAHEGPWAVVMPGVDNAEPRGAVSWGGYLMDYGRWGGDRPAGEMPDPLTYNTSYKREVLIEFDDQLDQALSQFTGMLWQGIARRGGRAWYEPAARIRHLGLNRLGSYVREKFMIGLLVGDHRAKNWSPGRRLIYFLGGPLIPFVLMYRERGTFRRHRRLHSLPWGTFAVVFLGCLAKAVGETCAVVVGASAAVRRKETDVEIRRLFYCRSSLV